MDRETLEAFGEIYANLRGTILEGQKEAREAWAQYRKEKARSDDGNIRNESLLIRAERAEEDATLLRAKYEPRTAIPPPTSPTPPGEARNF